MNEKNENQIIVMGDVHRDFGALNAFVNRKRPAIILQCGDFGYWPRMSPERMYGRTNPKYPPRMPEPKIPDGTKLYWCEGNHEDYWQLRDRKSDEIWPNTQYMPRGSTLTLPDGRVVMFMGGARSIDKNMRTFGDDWFPEETISESDVLRLDPLLKRVDIMISHTCPQVFPMKERSRGLSYFPDHSRLVLSMLLSDYTPKLWYFGHWHFYATGYTMGCRWTALDYANHGKWWEELRA